MPMGKGTYGSKVGRPSKKKMAHGGMAHGKKKMMGGGMMKKKMMYGGMACLLYTSPSPRDRQKSRMPSSA